MTVPPKVRIGGLEKWFGTNHVLRGLDLDVGVGESVAVIGGSGTGMSVLIKCVLGLLTPDADSIQIDGEEVVGMAARERERNLTKFGMLFRGSALFDSLAVWENVAFGLTQGRKIADRIAMIHHGKIIWAAPVAEIDHSDNPYIDQFIHGRAEGPIQMEVLAP